MATKSFAAAILGGTSSASYFIANILQASTEFSTTGRSLDRAILRNGGAGAPAFSPDFPGIYGAGAPNRARQCAASKSAAGDFLRNAHHRGVRRNRRHAREAA
jgi:hypothetical protein